MSSYYLVKTQLEKNPQQCQVWNFCEALQFDAAAIEMKECDEMREKPSMNQPTDPRSPFFGEFYDVGLSNFDRNDSIKVS